MYMLMVAELLSWASKQWFSMLLFAFEVFCPQMLDRWLILATLHLVLEKTSCFI